MILPMETVQDDQDLVERVRAAVAVAYERYVAAGYVGPMPLHGEAGGAKWRVDGPDPENPDWEGGYQCHCGEVFARPSGQGGMPAAFEALIVHQGGRVVS